MLILSRKNNESIMIGDDIHLVVCEIRGDKVRIGIDAPSDLPVHRLEVYNAIHRHHGHGITLAGRVHPQPTIVSARDGHLLLRFRDSADMQEAINRGRVSFALQQEA